MYCPFCGCADQDYAYCSACGRKLREDVQPDPARITNDTNVTVNVGAPSLVAGHQLGRSPAAAQAPSRGTVRYRLERLLEVCDELIERIESSMAVALLTEGSAILARYRAALEGRREIEHTLNRRLSVAELTALLNHLNVTRLELETVLKETSGQRLLAD